MRYRLSTQWDLSFAELDMLAAPGARRMDNVKEGMDAYLGTTDHGDMERARCNKLAQVLLHQKSLIIRPVFTLPLSL